MRWLLPFVALLAASCGGCGVPPPRNPIETGAAMAAKLEEQAARVGTLRAEVRAEQVTERGPVKGTVYLFLRPPDRVRFDSMTPVDTPLAVLVSDGTAFALHDVAGNRYYFGAPDPCNIARLLAIPLSAASALRVLLGLPPRLDAPDASVEWDRRHGWYVYREDLGLGVVQESHLAPLGGDLDTLSVRLTDGERLVYEIEFDDWHPVGDTRLPAHVRFRSAEAQGPVEVWYVDAEVDVELPDDAWTYPPPPGIPAEEVTCGTVIGPVGLEPER